MSRFLLYFPLILLGVICGCLIAEGGLRLLAGEQPAEAAAVDRKKGIMRTEQRTGWLPREGTETEYEDPPETGNWVNIRINSTGQRGGEVGRLRPDQRRILVLGDSYTMATQVEEKDTFVAGIERQLNADRPGMVQVVNGGVNGYGTYQQLAYYRYYGRPLEAEIVLLCFFVGNDFRDNMVSTRRGALLNPVLIPERERFLRQYREIYLRERNGKVIGDPLSGESTWRSSRPWIEYLQHKLLLARLLSARYYKLVGRWTADLDLLDLTGYYSYEIGFFQQRDSGDFLTSTELTWASLRQLQKMVSADAAEFMIVLLPSSNQIYPHLWESTLEYLEITEEDLGPLDKMYANRLVGDFCKTSQIPFLDLSGDFSASSNASDLYLTALGDGHFSAAGHRLAAAGIAAFIERNSRHLDDPSTTLFKAGKHHFEQQNWPQAEQAFLEASRQNLAWAPIYAALGDLYTRTEKWAAAEVAYRQALERDSGLAGAWARLASLLDERGDGIEAVAAYRQALKIRPNWWPYFQELSRIYAQLGMDLEARQAEKQVEVVFNAPGPLRIFWWMEHISAGTFFAAKGRLRQAESAFKRAIRFVPDEPVAYYNLGLLYRQLGDNQKEQASYRRALEVAPDFTPARLQLQ